jgi:hypothetical protein
MVRVRVGEHDALDLGGHSELPSGREDILGRAREAGVDQRIAIGLADQIAVDQPKPRQLERVV